MRRAAPASPSDAFALRNAAHADEHDVSADAAGGEGRFPRSARLLSPKQFQDVFKLGRRLNGSAYRLHAHLPEAAAMDPLGPTPLSKQQDIPRIRLGISVPKRVAALAVERNRIRRLARESFRVLRLQLPPGDYVLVALRDAKDAPSTILRDALASLWKRVGALKPEGAAPTMPIPKPQPAPAERAPPPHPVADPEPPPHGGRSAARDPQEDSNR